MNRSKPISNRTNSTIRTSSWYLTGSSQAVVQSWVQSFRASRKTALSAIRQSQASKAAPAQSRATERRQWTKKAKIIRRREGKKTTRFKRLQEKWKNWPLQTLRNAKKAVAAKLSFTSQFREVHPPILRRWCSRRMITKRQPALSSPQQSWFVKTLVLYQLPHSIKLMKEMLVWWLQRILHKWQFLRRHRRRKQLQDKLTLSPN